MAMRTVIVAPRLFLNSMRTTSMLHQLAKTNYVILPEMSRGFCASRALTSSSQVKMEEKKSQTVEEMITERIEEIKSGNFDKMKDPHKVAHFKAAAAAEATPAAEMVTNDGNYTLPHPIWSESEVHSVEVTHKTPKGLLDWLAFMTVKSLRTTYDVISGYKTRTRDEALWLNRIVFLETVAGVPGMVAAMVRHLHSLRKMRRDHGWIHTLLEEAENERMHLMTALQLKQPTLMFKGIVLASQGVFVTGFSIAYMISPRYCHRFVGYLEEEAVMTYTKCLKDIEDGPLSAWKTKPAPLIAATYWNLRPNATMKDVILAIRADEAHHRIVNHTLASMKKDDFNPYKPGF